jgi:hypothetical protein
LSKPERHLMLRPKKISGSVYKRKMNRSKKKHKQE